MRIAVPKETWPGERRVALVPDGVRALIKSGLTVAIERGAGEAAGIPDGAYAEAGAELGDRATVLAGARVILTVRAMPADAAWTAGQIVIGFADPLGNPAALVPVAQQGVTLLSMELMPRTTRAQSMDALSSMATVAGYKAVLLAADALPRMFPMMMTAAGTISPAKVFIVGAGVAGLQAISMARRLGAKVEAYDVRPAAKEQVLSLGAKFVELPLEAAGAEVKGGYAGAQDESFYKRQREMMLKVVAQSDVVITTAQVQGRRAPILLTTEMVEAMPPGSVVVDLAADRGGNCELTRADQDVIHNGVRVIGPSNLPAMVPFHASQMYSKNVVTFLQYLVKKEESGPVLTLNREDDIVQETLLTLDGAVVHARVTELLNAAGPAGSGEVLAMSVWSMAFVFMLATFVGLQVIKNVSRLLHTPLMSLTNAISAIAVVGALLVTGEQHDTVSLVLGAVAVAASFTNIVSGFMITDRMLRMFREKGPRA